VEIVKVADVTIYVPASGSTPEQKVMIPVSLSIGNVRLTPPGHFSGNYLFMPLLR
jgi:hypothetical protein